MGVILPGLRQRAEQLRAYAEAARREGDLAEAEAAEGEIAGIETRIAARHAEIDAWLDAVRAEVRARAEKANREKETP